MLHFCSLMTHKTSASNIQPIYLLSVSVCLLDGEAVYLYDMVIVHRCDVIGRFHACRHVPYFGFNTCLYDWGSLV